MVQTACIAHAMHRITVVAALHMRGFWLILMFPCLLQVPVLFTGSIRENLAPFGGHTDSALWSALRRAHLAPVVEDWEAEGLGGLDFVLGEGGSPLSAGQKQLLALARALLNPAKVGTRGRQHPLHAKSSTLCSDRTSRKGEPPFVAEGGGCSCTFRPPGGNCGPRVLLAAIKGIAAAMVVLHAAPAGCSLTSCVLGPPTFAGLCFQRRMPC